MHILIIKRGPIIAYGLLKDLIIVIWMICGGLHVLPLVSYVYEILYMNKTLNLKMRIINFCNV